VSHPGGTGAEPMVGVFTEFTKAVNAITDGIGFRQFVVRFWKQSPLSLNI